MRTVLNRSLDDWRRLNGAATAEEIAQQPAVWRALAATMAERVSETDAFLRDFLARPDNRVILTGAGTSAFIGEGLADHLNRHWPCQVRAIATTSLIAHPELYLERDKPTLLVSFARSGNSPESLAAVDLLRQQLASPSFLNITCNAEGALHLAGRGRTDTLSLLMPPQACDQSFAMTSSYSAMSLAALLVLEGGAWHDKLSQVTALADQAERLLAASGAFLAQLAQEPFERVVYLGSGSLAALAKEAALKVLELTAGKVVAVADTSLGFRHGPKSIVNGKTLVVCFVSADEHARRYDLDLLAELRRDGTAGRVLAVSVQAFPEPHPDDLVSPLAGASDAWLTPLWVILPQQYALHRAVALGSTPDNPFPGGEVNRVVQGVTLYPYSYLAD
jgi:tagatose-6-phosphate ketose/aldose isomerase